VAATSRRRKVLATKAVPPLLAGRFGVRVEPRNIPNTRKGENAGNFRWVFVPFAGLVVDPFCSGGDKTALPDLENAAHDHEPFIAEHAWWAVKEIEARRK
jgi:hypothetical protein